MHAESTPFRMPPNLALVGVAFLGLLIAIFLGLIIGENELTTLGFVCLIAFGFLFVAFLHRYVWQTSLFLAFLAIGFHPTTFAFGPLELSCGLAFAVAVLYFWQKRRVELPAVFNTPAFTFMQRGLFLWLVFVTLHMLYNFKAPYRPSEFNTLNAIKSYFALSAPLAVLLYFCKFPAGLHVKERFLWRICQFCFLGLIFNIGVRGYELATGGSIYIPIINSGPSPYILRTLGPLAMLLGAVTLTGRGIRKESSFRKCTYILLLALGAGGSLVSGGRATIIFGFAFVAVALALRKRIGLCAVTLALGIIGLAAAQLSSDYINTRANPYLQRSLQWILIEKSSASVESIQSSTDWRKELATRALAEWQSDSRIFWFGRATFGFGTQDDRAILTYGGYEALIQSSLRRGSTHNLFTDLLVAYGLVGCILYCIVYVGILVFLWQLRSRTELNDAGANLALACALLALFNFVFEVLGAGSYRIELLWFMVILIVAIYNRIALKDAQDHPRTRAPALVRSPSFDPARARHATFRKHLHRSGLPSRDLPPSSL